MQPIASILAEHGNQRDDCIKLLQEIQLAYGYLPKDVLRYVAEHSSISLRQIYGVATFYEWFRFQPVGEHMIRTCSGRACHVNGARQTTREVQGILGIDDRETMDDRMFTLESVACLGSCGVAAGAQSIYELLRQRADPEQVDLQQTGCSGLCHREPMLELYSPEGEHWTYVSLDAAGVERIVDGRQARREFRRLDHPDGPGMARGGSRDPARSPDSSPRFLQPAAES